MSDQAHTSASSPTEQFESVVCGLEDAWRHACAADRDAVDESVNRVLVSLRTLRSLSIAEDAAAMSDRLARHMDSLEDDARDFLRIGALSPAEIAERLAVLRFRSRILRRLARLLSNKPPVDEIPHLLVEGRVIEAGLQVRDATATDSVLHALDSVNLSRQGILGTVLASEIEQAAHVDRLDSDGADPAWRLARRLATGARDLGDLLEISDDADRRRLMVQADGESVRIEDRVIEFVSRAESPAEQRASITIWSRLADELEEVRLDAAEGGGAENVPAIDRSVFLGRRMKDALAASTHQNEEDVAVGGITVSKARRRLGRSIQRLLDQKADIILAARLNGLFGRRLVAIWEVFVFWLIMAVLGLIVVDHYREPDPEGVISWVTWVDTVICGFLLVDFGTRWALTTSRFRFVKRRLLTELLPSIPFGLLMNMQTLGAIKALRLGRVVRVLRVARPLMRLFRLFLFMMRAADRLVERNAWLLNRNIVFRSDHARQDDLPPLLLRGRDIDAWIDRSTIRLYRELPSSERSECAAVWSNMLLITSDGLVDVALRDESHRRLEPTELDADHVVRSLRELDDAQVADALGVEFATQITRMTRFLRLPFLRKVPMVRFVLGPDGAPDPLWITARLGRTLGDLLAAVQRILNFFADLYGVITGAQFLDRIGTSLMKATGRPARRLIILGVSLGLAALFLKLLRIPGVSELGGRLLDFISTPVIVLGLACAIPLLIGIWLRRVAGQAVDMYERVAEAQFLALTELWKERSRDVHVTALARRVVVPELLLRRGGSALHDVDLENTLHALASRELINGMEHAAAPAAAQTVIPGWDRTEFVLLFYRDFVDGAFFHANDTKIANMLLGNLTLENIRQNRLRYDRKSRRRLERLDIGRGKGGVAGPYMWFNFITHTIAQRTARLVIEYNQHCIPLSELEQAHPEDRRLYDTWIARRTDVTEKRPLLEIGDQEIKADGGTLKYRTTEFNALQFLLPDPDRDAMIEARYGKPVADILRGDRAFLIRDVFGTFPMDELPKSRRTINPYEIYRRHIASGRVFLLPLTIVWVAIRLFILGIRRLWRLVKDVVNPVRNRNLPEHRMASFDVARRKIHRMRRPVVLESMWLRAEFDVEYLGLTLPGRQPTVGIGMRAVDDLRVLDASESEWLRFRELKTDREHCLRLLARILRRRDLLGEAMTEEIRRRNPERADDAGKSVRALAAAFVCDHQGVREIAEAHELLLSVIDADGVEEAEHVEPRLGSAGRRKRQRRIEELFDRVLPVLTSTHGLDPEHRRRILDHPLFRSRRILGALEIIDEKVPDNIDPENHVMDILLEVADRPHAWSEQTLAVRTVQALGMIDLAGYEDLIMKLGDYSSEDVVRSGRQATFDM